MCPSRISTASPPPQPISPYQLPWNIDYDYYDDDDDDDDDELVWGDDETEEYTYTLIPFYADDYYDDDDDDDEKEWGDIETEMEALIHDSLCTSTQCSEVRLSHGTIVRIALGIAAVVMLVAVVMFLAGCLYKAQVQLMPTQASNGGVLAAGLEGITVDKAVKFAYEELSKATHDFHLGNKIGQGGFGSVYYAELRGQVWNSGFTFHYAASVMPYIVNLYKDYYRLEV
ncbi:hypothetical protein SSX86_006669 [Deinandra increscens subsp. villosa]|uniref:Uncharacterized protein n=1 Tax=Deinandra increscens subsp. villosa TaxID=3103831 RepID=A0AAP0DJY9_9ASTR